MDYEKKYKEALERAKQLSKELTVDDIVEQIFPELKEGEDERIRQRFIKLVKMSSEVGGFALHKWEADEMLTWLEKQAEQREDARWELLEKLLEADSIYQMAMNDAMVEYAKTKAISAISKLTIFDLLNPIDKVEKQGEKPQRKKALEAIKEERVDNANKIEPKFNEGDWLCEIEPNNYARFIQILETVNIQGKERYRISRDIHNDEDIVKFDFVEKYYHKFDIQDAKDGDILYSLDSKQPFIYKNRKPFNQAEAYCGINIFGKFFVWNTKDCAITLDKYVPATKEQRELLFKKMREAGYEWDDKEKKPIKSEVSLPSFDEQQCTPIVDIPFGAKDSELQEASYHIPEGFHAEIQGDMVVINKGEKKSSWDEEDENNLTDICVAIRKFYHGTNGAQELIDWLKSLKQRMKGE